MVNGRTAARLEAAVACLGGKARGVAPDLGTAEQHAALVAAEPPADIVISDPGNFQASDFIDTDDAVWIGAALNVVACVWLALSYPPAITGV